MKSILAIFIILYMQVPTAEAQEVFPTDTLFTSLQGEHYIFGDIVPIYASEEVTELLHNDGETGTIRFNQKGPVIDTLYAGQIVSVWNQPLDCSVVNGFKAPWIFITYNDPKTNQKKEGYVWSGMLSLNPVINNNNSVWALVGIDSVSADQLTGYVTIKMFDRNKYVDSKTIVFNTLSGVDYRIEEIKLEKMNHTVHLRDYFIVTFIRSYNNKKIYYYFAIDQGKLVLTSIEKDEDYKNVDQ